MANIPIERTGTPWWVWLLGLLLLVGLIWFLLEAFDDEEMMVAEDPVEVVSPPAIEDGAMDPIEDGDMDSNVQEVSLSDLSGDLSAMAGQMVDLDNVDVMAVAGDSTFYVGENGTRTLVVLESLRESESGPGTGADGVFNVDVGDQVSINGMITAFQPGMRGTVDLSEADQTAAEERRYVIVVDDRGEFES